MSIHHPLKADNISNYSTLTADQPAVVEAEAGPHEVPMTPPEAAGRWKTAMNKKPFEVNFETVSGSGVSHQELTIRSALFLDAHIAHGKQPVEFPPSSASNIQLWVAWPGYEKLGCKKNINIRGITISQLAGKVAFEYEQFFKEALQKKHTVGMFRLTPELFRSLRLVNIRRVGADLYQAGYFVDWPPLVG